MLNGLLAFLLGREVGKAQLPDSVKQQRYDARMEARARQRAINKAVWQTPFGRFAIWVAIVCGIVTVIATLK